MVMPAMTMCYYSTLMQVIVGSHHTIKLYVELREAKLAELRKGGVELEEKDYVEADLYASQFVSISTPVKIFVPPGRTAFLDGWTLHAGDKGEEDMRAWRFHFYSENEDGEPLPFNETYPINILIGDAEQPTNHFAALLPDMPGPCPSTSV